MKHKNQDAVLGLMSMLDLEEMLRAKSRMHFVNEDALVTIENLQNKNIAMLKEAATIQAAADADSNRELSPEEIVKVNALLDAVDRQTEEIERRQRIRETENRLSAPGSRRTVPDDAPPANDPARNQTPRRSSPITGGEPAGLTRGAWGFRSFGEFARSVRASTRGNVDPRLVANAAPTVSANEGVGEDGGFAVPPDFRAEIVKKVMGEDSILSLTDGLTTSSNQITVPVDETTPWQSTGGIQAYWEGEAAQLAQSKIELQSKTVRLSKLTALVPVTSELLEDVSALSSYLRTKTPDKLNYKVNDALINGTGAGQPQGILASPAKVTIAAEAAQATATVNLQNLLKMWARLYAPCRKNAVWMINQDVEPQLSQLALIVGSATTQLGFPVYMPPGGLSGNPYSTLYGRPIIVTEACSALGTEGDIMLVDWSKYLTATKVGGGIREDVSIHLWFDYDTAAYRFIMRLGGQSWWTNPIKRKNGNNTLSHIVSLAARP